MHKGTQYSNAVFRKVDYNKFKQVDILISKSKALHIS